MIEEIDIQIINKILEIELSKSEKNIRLIMTLAEWKSQLEGFHVNES